MLPLQRPRDDIPSGRIRQCLEDAIDLSIRQLIYNHLVVRYALRRVPAIPELSVLEPHCTNWSPCTWHVARCIQCKWGPLAERVHAHKGGRHTAVRRRSHTAVSDVLNDLGNVIAITTFVSGVDSLRFTAPQPPSSGAAPLTIVAHVRDIDGLEEFGGLARWRDVELRFPGGRTEPYRVMEMDGRLPRELEAPAQCVKNHVREVRACRPARGRLRLVRHRSAIEAAKPPRQARRSRK
ncbi:MULTISPECIES: hypothetical protein [unclassified Leifsonia]|uniref:hypothetical protein n=1 Tax=unclassified Leifsonia TaxID=2663824 RepID=UPI0015607EB4|nr:MULTISPECIES: hypothetical protein [unclassified Leifsonia]